jgi:hypothetical protein
MKLRSLLTLSALTVGMTGLANAQTTNIVYLTGSTAFRGDIYSALATNTFDSAPSIAVYKTSAVTPTDPTTGGLMNFTGDIASAHFIVKCDWSGSEAGIADLTAALGGSKETFLTNGTPAIVTSTSPAGALDTNTVDIALADTDQAASTTKTPALTGLNIGIVPFVVVKNAQTNAGVGATITTPPTEWVAISNITCAQIRIIAGGGQPLAILTGNNANTNFVYLAGRDNQSGTFANFYIDTGFGLVKSPSQVIVTNGGGGYASQFGQQLFSGKGKGIEGYNSGGTLATSMTLVGSATNEDFVAENNGIPTSGWYAITYLGLADASVAEGIVAPVAAPNGAAVQLTFEGVQETPANVENGTYPFFGNEWIFQSKNNFGANGNAATVYNKLVSGGGINAACDGTNYISLNSMFGSKINSQADFSHN